ncbi:MAG TPA: DUF2249 domain-containing protein [Castellaniella sp.]|uniref:DUF2249 domain-containing protein n=1 Tax=Castellaniella sp. TaxID=1955812 RepID=UPI002F1D8F94
MTTLPDLTLDVRGLPAPEPLEQCLDALADLPAGQRLQLWVDREPFPLYVILAREGFEHACTFEGPHYRVTIWRN